MGKDVVFVKDLSKDFRIESKQFVGFRGWLASLFEPHFDVVEAVKGVSFSIAEGEMVAFIGPNGAGKSTTIKMLTGVLSPTAGQIRVLGLDPIKSRRRLAYMIGTVFGQRGQLWSHLTLRDNFKFFATMYDINGVRAQKKVEEICALFDLKDLVDVPIKNLSLGQKIRCELAVSVIHEPKILFLDEPTIGLDPVVKENVRSLIKKLNREHNTTVFLTSHDVGDIEKLCKRIIIMNKGKIVLDSTIENLYKNYLTKKVLKIKTKEETKIRKFDNAKILDNEATMLTLEIDTSKEAINDLMKKFEYDNIVDITIANQPLEEIISKIYSTRGET